MNLRKYNKSLQIPVTINKEGDSYWGEAVIFPGCFSTGDTLEDFSNNLTDAIIDYTDSVNEGFFDFPNTGILNININEDGGIESSIVKRIDKDSYLTLSRG